MKHGQFKTLRSLTSAARLILIEGEGTIRIHVSISLNWNLKKEYVCYLCVLVRTCRTNTFIQIHLS